MRYEPDKFLSFLAVNGMIPLQGLLKTVAKGLSPNTEALLVFGLACVAAILMYLGVNQWLACLFPLSLYLLYRWRAEQSERHKVEMARLALEKLDVSRSARLEKAWNKTIQIQTKSSSKVRSK
ncbi:hypothetical protein ATB98_02970 [Sinorhizobium saheli]|uniref:Uncharacterized protein n=1 Tax=Sinorhizobium saheli TaxID=36856 RepID=A0A178XVL7_SINSA|nr:hypothetical protein ATB98_02970 [Sinorhizobium saheli]